MPPRLPFDFQSMYETIYRKTVDRFRSRWNNYKESDKKFLRRKEIKQQSLNDHLFRDGHQSSEEDASLCLIDKTNPFDLNKRDSYRMRTLKTIALFGFNTKETC